MNLFKQGYFAELPYGNIDDLTIKDYIGKLTHKEHKLDICNYLSSGVPLAVSCDLAEDVINPQNGISGCPSMLTDGRYVWHEDLAYYVQKYDLNIDEEFYSFMKANNWLIKITIEDINFDDIFINDEKAF